MTTEPTSTELAVHDASTDEVTRRAARAVRTRKRRTAAALAGLLAVVAVAGVLAVGLISGWLSLGGAPTADVAGGASSSIQSFTVTPEQANCQSDRGAGTATLSFSWSAPGAEQAWIGEGASDASQSPLAEVPVSAEDWSEVAFPCHLDEMTYTLTVEDAGGTTSQSVTVTRSNQ